MDFVLPHLLFLLILLPIFSIAQNNGNVTTGKSLTATNNSSPWLSPSGDFAFGFHPLNQTDLFLLSIWFANVSDKTIVWVAKDRLDTIPAPRGAKVELTADHGLVLTGPQGDPLWSSNILGTVANGFMSNTGNFELHDRNFNKLWESFKNPTDTLLPSQNMDIGGVLSSRQSETHFSIGRFQLRLIPEGNLVLNAINLPTDNPSNPYYESGTSKSDSVPSNPGKQLVLNQSGYIYILRDNNQTLPLRQGKPESAAEFYFRATLNFDGVFTLYSYPKNSSANGIWTPIWSVPDNICVASSAFSDSGTCGFNSICTLGSDKRPICTCPKGYSLLDPNDPYGSCKPDFILQGCEEDKLSPRKDLYYFEVLTNTYFINSENYAILKPYTEDQCSKSCMDDCMCVVAVFKEGDTCYKKKLPLSNGRVDNSIIGGKAYMKIRKNYSITLPDHRLPIPETKKKNHDNLILMWSALLASSVFVNIILIVAICVGVFSIYNKKFKTPMRNFGAVEMNLRCFTYQELVEATDGFKEELGKGAFGVVYKGAIEMGSSVLVAVKKLNSSIQDYEREFKTEVNVISQTHHKNLVRLLGFCDEGLHRLLVYEFLRNGTLATFLFGDLKPSWNQRIQIAVGIAKGL